MTTPGTKPGDPGPIPDSLKREPPKQETKPLAKAVELVAHPIANIFPRMSNAEFDDLVEDIKEKGLQEHIWLYEGKILDGRNRYQACKDAGKPCPTRNYTGNDPHGFVISANLKRRHLDESQRASVAALLVTTKWGDNQHREERSIDLSSAADMLNVSKKSVQRAVVVRDKGDQQLQKLVDDGKVAVSVAHTLASKLPKAQQAKIARGGDAEVRKAAKGLATPRQPKAQPSTEEILKRMALDPGDMWEVLKKVYDKDERREIVETGARDLGMTLTPAPAPAPKPTPPAAERRA
jgi:hypothetical protein